MRIRPDRHDRDAQPGRDQRDHGLIVFRAVGDLRSDVTALKLIVKPGRNLAIDALDERVTSVMRREISG